MHKKQKTMSHILKNDHLEIQIDLPLENYNFSRFDWTGKIVAVWYKNRCISGVEQLNNANENKLGKGFCNEFGFNRPLGFAETQQGDWFHKIGVGLLKKESNEYLFSHKYEIQPADFKVYTTAHSIKISCESAWVNGYSYLLEKEIILTENGFVINYYLKNTGEKTILTDEYNHNFISIIHELVGSDYILKFPFKLKSESFEDKVNTEGKVEIGESAFGFKATPNEQFFFSNLSGSENVSAYWELISIKNKIGISETGNFHTAKINLWGWKHVISPELYFEIMLEPGKVAEWSRTYTILETIS